VCQPQRVDTDAEARLTAGLVRGRVLTALERHRWYRSSGASQRSGDYLLIELADNTTSRFLK
jgi:hypothetical protein